MSQELQILTSLPDGFCETPASGLHALLDGPTLIHLPGPSAPLFVSTLLHGNETTGFEALQALLADYPDQPLPRALSIFIGNVQAAAQGKRLLPGQADFNRIWPDGQGQLPANTSAEAAWMTREVVTQMRDRQVVAALDLHNTSGRNPPHACVNVMRADCIRLAARFTRRVLYFTRPKGVVGMAFSPLCPTVTVESGPVGRPEHSELTLRFLRSVLQTPPAADEASADQGADMTAEDNLWLYRSVARVEIPEGQSFGIGEGEAGLRLVENIDGYNWREIPAGTLLAYLDKEIDLPTALRVTNASGEVITADYLSVANGELRTRVTLTPAMLSLDKEVIQQDCLCYFLERVC